MKRPALLSLIAVGLTAASLVAYWPIFSSDFVNFDDGAYVFDNPEVKNGLTASGIVWSFTEVYSANWHPLTWISHMVDVSLFGVSAPGHHVVNWLFHVANAIILFLLLERLTGQVWPSAGVALLFAVHPLNVESVAWISERKNVLSTLLGLLSIWCYAAWARRKDAGQARIGWYLGAVGLFALSLMAKQMLVTLPFVLLLLDYWPLARAQFGPADPTASRDLMNGWLRLSLEKWPFFALTIAASVVTLVAQQQAMAPIETLSFGVRLANALTAYVSYLGMTIWPVRLAIYYPHAGESTSIVLGILAGLGVVALTAAAWWIGRSRRYVLVGWLWYLGTLVPVIGLVQVGGQSMADRYMYVPLIGIFLIVAFGLADLFASLALDARSLATATATLLLVGTVAMVWRTHDQVRHWYDTFTLFSHAAEVTDRNFVAHVNLGAIYLGRREFEKAIEHSTKAIEYYPAEFDARLVIGCAMLELNSTDQALQAFGDALKIRSDDPVAMGQFGVALAEGGRYRAAQPYLEKAAKLAENPTREGPIDRKLLHRNWGNILARSKNFKEALARYEKALEFDPKFVQALREAAEVSMELGDSGLAVKRLESALSIDKQDDRALAILGTILAQQGQYPEALDKLSAAIALDPDRLDTRMKLGKALRAVNRIPDAERELRKVLEAEATEENSQIVSEACVQLAQLELAAGHADESRTLLDKALDLNPANIEGSNDLAWQLATQTTVTPEDAKRALQLANFACGKTDFREPSFLGTLSAAYAANGDFKQAVTLAEQGLRIAKEDQRHAWLVAQLERQLAEHKSGKPWVEKATP